ncbi:uncharacterized protein LOC117344967 [Pecten maximus]|uniref:uncharacterized protein LOC117344967 n=1 Tax=Pecten maximus TaxID=6579 RepID=UPI001457F4D6|nr:uncharacterized protein LOC117344967 [Pecten maximus]
MFLREMGSKLIGNILRLWLSLLPLLYFATIAKGEVTCSHVDAYNKNQVVLANARCYHLAQDAISWNDAVTSCHSNNGTLASIPNATVNAALIKRAVNLDYNNLANVSFYWIGGRVNSSETGVTWLQDPGTGYSALSEDEPHGSGEHGCLVLDPGKEGWATDVCEAELELVGYICEYPSRPLQALHSGREPVLNLGVQSGLTCCNKAGIVFLCLITSIITRRLVEEF